MIEKCLANNEIQTTKTVNGLSHACLINTKILTMQHSSYYKRYLYAENHWKGSIHKCHTLCSDHIDTTSYVFIQKDYKYISKDTASQRYRDIS